MKTVSRTAETKEETTGKGQETRAVLDDEENHADVSVIIPVRDEAANLPELIVRLVRALEAMGVSFELIFVTDVNTDNTLEVLLDARRRDSRVKAIKLTTSGGQHVAVVAGLDVCQGRAVVLMDGDLQDSPEDIPELYSRLNQGFDVVYGIKEKKNDSAMRNFLSKSFVWVLNRLSDQKLEYNTSMFRIMSRRTVEQLRRFREQEQSLTGLMSLINFPTDKILVASGQRAGGQTKYSLKRQIDIAINFLLSFSTKPLRLISVFGLFVAGLSFVYFLITIAQTLILGIPVQGWATLVSLVTFLSGVQLVALGTIGEYVGKIFMETKRRPLYIVDDNIGDHGGEESAP